MIQFTYKKKVNLFSPTTFTWWQLGLLKWAVFLVGIAVGASWPLVFAKYSTTFLVIGLIISIYLFMIWNRQHSGSSTNTS